MPTVAVLLFGAWFLAHDVPRIVRDRREQISAETEAAANNARLDPSKADFIWQRGKGIVKGDAARFGDMFPADMTWKAWRPMRRFNQKDNMLGWRETPVGRLVWARGRTPDDDTLVYARLTDIDVRDYAFTLNAAVCVFLAVLVGMTFASVRFFIEYIHSRDDFMVAAAHDMTTPLVGMRYLIGRDDATARNLNERMIRLVANIKDFMRLGGRRARPERRIRPPFAGRRQHGWCHAQGSLHDEPGGLGLRRRDQRRDRRTGRHRDAPRRWSRPLLPAQGGGRVAREAVRPAVRSAERTARRGAWRSMHPATRRDADFLGFRDG